MTGTHQPRGPHPLGRLLRRPLYGRVVIMRAVLVVCGILAFATPLLGQGEDQRFAAGTDKVAAEALTRFAALVTRENYRQMGFDSPEQVRSASLGPPMRQFSVGLDDLKKFDTGSDPSKLLAGADTLIYPVLAGDGVRSSITLQRDSAGGWRAVAFGAPIFTRAVWGARPRSEAAGASPFIVRVPALNLFFLGTRRDGELMLAPVVDDPRLKFEKGVPVPAATVFAALVPLARAHNDLPT